MIKIAVIGLGRMGYNHIRAWQKIAGVCVVGGVDPSLERRGLIFNDFAIPCFASIDELPAFDAVSITNPSSLHVSTAMQVINDRKADCFIEKPLALSQAEGQKLIDLAEQKNCIIAVGHIERFNPAIIALENELANLGAIHAINSWRMAKANHITDVDVVDDLMIHDIDIALNLISYPDIKRVVIDGIISNDAPGYDMAVATLHSDNDVIITCGVSRITPIRTRRLEIYAQNATAQIDYLRQSVNLNKADNYQQQIKVNTSEALQGELNDFLSCVINRNTPHVSAKQALISIAVIEKIKLVYPK